MADVVFNLSVGAHIGAYGLLGTIIILLLQRPERAEKLQALLLAPTFRLFKVGARRYIAAKVGATASEFINRRIVALAPSLSAVKVRVKWVRSASDPVFASDGTLVLRMRETNDQTLNILTATRAALPYVVCSTVRANVNEETETAVDLALIHNLAGRLGKHARPLFQRHFMTPEIAENAELLELFRSLVELDESGLFVSIFIEELNILGESLFDTGDTRDRSREIADFLEYLLPVARREEHERIRLLYVSSDIRVGIVLLALSRKAQVEGVTPYLGV